MLVYTISLVAFPIGSEYHFLNRKSKSFNFYLLTILSVCVCMLCLSWRVGGGYYFVRAALDFCFTWTPGMELRSLGFCSKHLYYMRHLTINYESPAKHEILFGDIISNVNSFI